MSATLRSPDIVGHASVFGGLSNARIDHYCLLGHYGRERQLEVLNRVKSGKCKRFDKKILKKEYGDEAQRYLKARQEVQPRAKKQPEPVLDHAAMLRDILSDLGSASAGS